MALCSVASVAILADGKTYGIISKVLCSQAWERFTEAQATMMGHSGNALGSGSAGLGDFVGPAGPGLISLFCFGLPLFPGKTPLAFSNYCDRKMRGSHHSAALSAHPLSL